MSTTDTEGQPEPVLWSYLAIDRQRSQRRGELMAQSAADARASLRRIGLQVLDIRPLRSSRQHSKPKPNAFGGSVWQSIRSDVCAWWCRRSRAQRASARAECYDGLATMLSSGLPLLEAMQTFVESREFGSSRNSPLSLMRFRSNRLGGSVYVEMREVLRGGGSLAEAMRGHPTWFDDIDIAIVQAGQHSGMLASVLAGLAQRQERSNEVAHKLAAALAYPILVMLVGIGVIVFLSVRTLPDLTKILVDARIPIPGLTAKVMWLGQSLAAHWHWLAVSAAGTFMCMILGPGILARASTHLPIWMERFLTRITVPRFMRRLQVGTLVGGGGLADLLRSGVPVVESLRVLAPAQTNAQLRRVLIQAADRVEQGEDLSVALDDHRWFDAEMRRLLDVGQASGELDDMLRRIGGRYERRARRLIDRITAFLEPVMLLLLAVMVGTVVMAAILPLLALQKVIQ